MPVLHCVDTGARYVEWLSDWSFNVQFPSAQDAAAALAALSTPLPPVPKATPPVEQNSSSDTGKIKKGTASVASGENDEKDGSAEQEENSEEQSSDAEGSVATSTGAQHERMSHTTCSIYCNSRSSAVAF